VSGAFAIAALIWAATIAYAGVTSGLAEIRHQCLSVIGALLGYTPVDAGTGTCGSLTGSANTGTTNAGSVGSGDVASAIVAYARSQIGMPYVWAGPTNQSCDHPNGFDCSGLVKCAVFKATNGGLQLPHSAAGQYAILAKYAISKNPETWVPGDLVFYLKPSTQVVGHVAIVSGSSSKAAGPGATAGSTLIIEALDTSHPVSEDPLNAPGWRIVGARRPALWGKGTGKPAGGDAGARQTPSNVVPLAPRRSPS
jgi:cell wall-associated NlpC family hydrolase